MKGVIKLLFELIIVVIAVAIIVGSFYYLTGNDNNIRSNTPEISVDINLPYAYTNYILNENGFETATAYEDYFESDSFCQKVKQCINSTIITGIPCVVDIVSYKGTGLNDQNIKNIYPDIGLCDNEDMNNLFGPGIWQKTCYYDGVGSGSLTDISQTVGLDYTTCDFSSDTITEDFPSNWLSARYYSSDYYHHYKGASDYDIIGNGPGKVKIVIGRAKSDSDGLCKVTTRLCMQTAFAETEDDATLKIFDIMRKLQIYIFEEDELPYYIKDYSRDMGVNIAYVWNDYNVTLDKPYSITAISDAIISGFSKNPNEYVWQNDDKWSIKTGGGDIGTKQIIYYCDDRGSADTCEGNIKIEIEVVRSSVIVIDNIPRIKTLIVITED